MDKSFWKLIMITKEKMLWSFIKWKWAEIGMENYCVRGVFLNFSCWQISWPKKSFSIILKLQLQKKTGHILNILSKQPWFHDPTTGFPAKWRLRKDCNNSILVWRVITQIWVVLLIGWGKFRNTTNQKHYPGLQCWRTSFRGKTSETSAREMLAVSSG